MSTPRIAVVLTAALVSATAAPALAVPHDADLGTTTSTTAPRFVPPRLVLRAEPAYTDAARAASIEGTIDLDLGVDPTGRVDSVTILSGLGSGLDEEAERAAKLLVFAPAHYEGQAVRCTVRWHFHFRIRRADDATKTTPSTDPALEAHDPDRSLAPEPTSDGAREAAPHEDASASSDPTTANAAVPAPTFEVTVRGQAPADAASATTLRPRDFLLRPHTRPADVLAAAPGLYVVQHAGGGKANQYFMRGFDADHGTDLSFAVDGVPVNMPSHGHGQGYTDLNWLIPEIVERIEVRKGPYYAELGDFATGGAVDIVTTRNVQASSFTLGGGAFDTLRSLFVASPEGAGFKSLVAAELFTTNGPFQHGEGLQRYSALARVSHDVSPRSRLSLSLTSYAAGWNASGQLPLREVAAGRLDRFGSLDPSEGGASQRHAAQASWLWRGDDGDELDVMGYVVHNRFRLFSNFTLFSADPVHGDMIEQGDVRTFGGARSNYRFLTHAGDVGFDTKLGLAARADSIDNALHHDQERKRLDTRVDATVLETTIGAFSREEITWTPWLRTIFGLRADWYGFRVADHLDAAAGTSSAQAALLSPKATLVLSPLPNTELYANAGYGFHSNDARGVVRASEPVTALTRGLGYELGARTKLFDRVELAASAFRLDLDGEIVWVGDEGTTEARGPTRRIGLETEARVKLLDWLWVDGDLTWTDSTYVDLPSDANAVALAPRVVASAGVSAEHPAGYYGRVGAVHIADRPATEDRFLTAQGFTRVDAMLGYKSERFDVSVTVQNLLDTTWREAQFGNVSRLESERSASSCPNGTRAVTDGGTFAGCEDVHFTPGAPLNAMASASLYF